MSNHQISVLIPAYKPKPDLIVLVDQLIALGLESIVVVDDGGGKEFMPIMQQLDQKESVIVLHHAENQGKGAALKTGLQYIYEHHPDCTTVVTADADGQHIAGDILKVAKVSLANPTSLALGVRQFHQMIPKSRFGNTVTHWVFRLFFGLEISDTQTGLRGIPRKFIPACLEIPFNRYEYETEMLLISKAEGLSLTEIPIETIYLDQNKGSHFNVIVDSTKIYFVIFRYTLASLASALVDYVIFISLFGVFASTPISIFGARSVSLFVNYLLLHYKVYYSQRRPAVTFPRYIGLVIFSGILATVFIELLHEDFGWNVSLAKVVVELIIYFFNFMMNTLFVFVGRRKPLEN